MDHAYLLQVRTKENENSRYVPRCNPSRSRCVHRLVRDFFRLRSVGLGCILHFERLRFFVSTCLSFTVRLNVSKLWLCSARSANCVI